MARSYLVFGLLVFTVFSWAQYRGYYPFSANEMRHEDSSGSGGGHGSSGYFGSGHVYHK